MKKILPLLMSVIFLFNSMGNYLVYELNKFIVKQEMQALVNNRHSNRRQMILKIFQPEHNRDFRRVEAREIRFKGKLFDIIRETREGNNTVFYCIHDIKEELLIAGFAKVQHSKITLALLHNLVTQALPLEVNQAAEQHGVDFPFPEKNDLIDWVYLSLFAPPPEIS